MFTCPSIYLTNMTSHCAFLPAIKGTRVFKMFHFIFTRLTAVNKILTGLKTHPGNIFLFLCLCASASPAAGHLDVITGEEGSPAERLVLFFFPLWRGVYCGLITGQMSESIHPQELIRSTLFVSLTQLNGRLYSMFHNTSCFFPVCFPLDMFSDDSVLERSLQLKA